MCWQHLQHVPPAWSGFSGSRLSLTYALAVLAAGCISALRGCSSSKQQTAGCSSGPYVQRVPRLVDLCSEALTRSCDSNNSRFTRQEVPGPRSLRTSARATYPAQKLPGTACHQLFRALPARLFARPWGLLYTSAAAGNTTTDSIPAADPIRLPHSAASSSAHPRRRRVPLSTASPAAAPARQVEVDAKPPAPQRVEEDPQPDSRISGLIRRSSSARRQPSAQQASAADTATAAAAEAHATSPAGAGRPSQVLNPALSQAQLTGTEEQLFARALEYVPAAELAEVAEVAQVGCGVVYVTSRFLSFFWQGRGLDVMESAAHRAAHFAKHLHSRFHLAAAPLLCPFDLLSGGHWVIVSPACRLSSGA